jgi:hypothetical protein
MKGSGVIKVLPLCAEDLGFAINCIQWELFPCLTSDRVNYSLIQPM